MNISFLTFPDLSILRFYWGHSYLQDWKWNCVRKHRRHLSTGVMPPWPCRPHAADKHWQKLPCTDRSGGLDVLPRSSRVLWWAPAWPCPINIYGLLTLQLQEILVSILPCSILASWNPETRWPRPSSKRCWDLHTVCHCWANAGMWSFSGRDRGNAGWFGHACPLNYVSMNLCIYVAVCLYVYMCEFMHACTHRSTNTYIYIYTNILYTVYIYLLYTYMHACMLVYRCV